MKKTSYLSYCLAGALTLLSASAQAATIDWNSWTSATAGTFAPDPGTMLFLGTGLFALAIYGKRRRNA